ncbi:MAG TPA: VWA domain-containing protein, partial [Gemmataceae bacterium]|nr:VWA domain-containing protein [Gemmataceae bacterium]
SYRSLAGLGPVRRWIAIGLRCALVIFLTLALAEVRLRHQNENITVLYLVDRSFSIPVEFDSTVSPDANRIDRRTERVEQFINYTVENRGPLHRYDRAGLILFGRRPRLELPPSNAPAFNFKTKDAASTVDGNYTDIAAAIKLALASFPEGTGKRIVLISDGNENLGNAEEQARIAKLNGVQIDVVPLAAGYRNENEVLVQAVEAPPRTEQGSRLPIRVLIRSYNPFPVYGTLILKQITDGETIQVPTSPRKVKVNPGLTPFAFQQPLTNQSQSYTYQAIFVPEAVENGKGGIIQGLEGDRVQNNSATTHVVALGQRRILVIEPEAGQHQLLVDRLKAMANSKYKVHTITPARLPESKDELGVFLSNYDSVIMANVPAEMLNDEQQEMIRSNTSDQGCGLIMIGGPDGFGAGGWQGTPIEKALPVDCDIKSFKVQAKGGLVLIMHACEMADGNRWEKEIAKLSIKKLSPNDEIGIIHYEWGGHKWHIPLQVIGKKQRTLLGMVDRMTPGDMPDFDGPLKMAYDALTDPKRQLATRHVIVITDGDPQLTNRTILSNMRKNGVSLTTVGVATHGVNEDKKLLDMAASASKGGKFHKVMNPNALPKIYIKETRLVSQSFVHQGRFVPGLKFKEGPTEKMPDTLMPLWGFVRTTPKESPLVEISIVGPPAPEQENFPILAYWHYGLGKSVAFTSDARSQPGKPAWDREWAGSDMYSKFWEQAVEWSLRPTETGHMTMITEYNDGRVKVTVDARDEANRPLTDLLLRGGVTSPLAKGESDRKLELKFEQKNSGLYEAEFKAEEAGYYFVNAQAVRQVETTKGGKKEMKEEALDSVRSGVTIPYSPEFADLESNTALMERLRDMTGGKTLSEDLLAKAADLKNPQAEGIRSELAQNLFRSGLPQFKNLQPVWFWLVFLAGVGLFFDVAVRRIAIQPAEAAVAAERVWSQLRGRAAAAVQTPQFIDRLQSRKAQVSEALEQLRAAKRFEGGDRPVSVPAGAEEAEVGAPRLQTQRAPAQQRLGPETKKEATDYASRLLKAKKRVWQDRKEDEP